MSIAIVTVFVLCWLLFSTNHLIIEYQAQGPHSHILMTGGSDRGSYFIPKKIPTSEFVRVTWTTRMTGIPKKIPTFFNIPQKIPQCFCISKFYYLSSGKLKHANFNFGFGQKQNYKLRLCYFLFELMKNTIPKKIPVLFSRPKEMPASFIDPKNPFWPNCQTPKNPSGPPSLKYVSGAPGLSGLRISRAVSRYIFM